MVVLAKDDYYVIVYKLLSYLYSCLKKGTYVDIENLRDVIKVDIVDSYWNYIILELYKEGYIDGITKIKYIGDINENDKKKKNIRIKPKGIEFLESNSFVAKAKEFIKEAGEILFWL